MNAYEKIEKLNDSEFKLITGVNREVFYDMVEGNTIAFYGKESPEKLCTTVYLTNKHQERYAVKHGIPFFFLCFFYS